LIKDENKCVDSILKAMQNTMSLDIA
jgi:hypothetical protein